MLELHVLLNRMPLMVSTTSGQISSKRVNHRKSRINCTRSPKLYVSAFFLIVRSGFYQGSRKGIMAVMAWSCRHVKASGMTLSGLACVMACYDTLPWVILKARYSVDGFFWLYRGRIMPEVEYFARRQ